MHVATARDDMEDLYNRMNARLISLEGSVGLRHEPDEDLPPTLWETVSSLWTQAGSPATPSTAATTPAEAVSGFGRVATAIDAIRQHLNTLKKDHSDLSEVLSKHELKAS